MGVEIYTVFCFFIASTNAFAIWPPFLDTAQIKNDVHDTLSLRNEISKNIDVTKDDLLLNSGKVNVAAESASSVLSRLKSMFDSPYDDAKEYAAEKAKELVSNIEHNTNKVIQFTLNGANLMVDLGIKGSPTRLRNLEQGRFSIAYFSEWLSWIMSSIKSLFVTERNDIDNTIKGHKQNEKNEIADPSSTAVNLLTREDEKEKYLTNEFAENHSSEDESKTCHKNPVFLQASNDIITFTPKELSSDEKGDVERARQQLILIEKTLQELEDKMKLQHINDDEKIRLEDLKKQAGMKKKFIKISISERIK